MVAFGSLGGTITMTRSASSGGIEPSLNAGDLLASVPGLAEVADIRPATLASVPGASLRPDDVLAALDWARTQVETGARGVVLAQGTDTIEETAYLAELYWDRPEPLVVTGAMRGPGQMPADGPANLLAACQVALAPAARDIGVLVVLDGTAHMATRVRKTHSTALNAGRSPDGGPAGGIVEGDVWLRPERRVGAPLDRPTSDAYVPMLETYLGDDGSVLRTLLAAGLDGVAVGGFGVAHTSTGLADRLAAAARTVPVVVSTRTGSGGTLSRTYGFQGSEIDLQSRGVILSGALDTRKSRLLLWALLSCGASAERVRSEFASRGRR